MPVSDDVTSAVRAMLMGDEDRAVTLLRQLDKTDDVAFNLLFEAVLAVTACKRFAEGFYDADLIQYVARIRSDADLRAEDRSLDPKVAESTLRHALGKPVPYIKGAEQRMRATLALLAAMFADLEMDEPGAEAILAEARAFADQWLLEWPSAAAE